MPPDMNRPIAPRKSKSPKATRLMAIDAWIDSTLYEAGCKASELWESPTTFSRRYRFTGCSSCQMDSATSSIFFDNSAWASATPWL